MGGHSGADRDLIARGVKRFSLSGALTFVGIRALDVVVQYNILGGHWATSLFTRLGIVPITAPASFLLSLPPAHLLLLGMCAGAAVKQSYWLLFICQEELRPAIATLVGLYNCFASSVNSLLFMAAATSSIGGGGGGGGAPTTRQDLPYTVALGTLLYVVGIALEAVSEQQRRRFKADPVNKGKVMRSGLWGWARHINYGGYLLWRSGYGLAASGWTAAVFWGGLMAHQFVASSVPLLDSYCSSRYGEQWRGFKQDVKWELLPWIY